MLRRAHVQLCTAHPEGLRERPSEVPATAASLRRPTRSGRGNGANSVRREGRAGEDEEEDSMSTARRREDQQPLREGAFGHATALSCRECGHQVELGPFYACPECFGPLEIAYDFPAGHPRGDRGRPAPTSGATRRCCRCPTDIEESPNTEPGFTRLLQGEQPRPRARHRQPVGQGRLDQPHQLLQGPGGRLRAERRPRARRQGLRLPEHRQPRQRRRRRRCPRRHQDRGLHPEQPRAAQAGQLRDLHRARWSP